MRSSVKAVKRPAMGKLLPDIGISRVIYLNFKEVISTHTHIE